MKERNDAANHLLVVSAAIFVGSFVGLAEAQFDTVINLPGEVAPPSVGANTQVNVFEGGNLPTGFDLGSPDTEFNNSELNVLGGRVTGLRGITANAGTQLNIEGGAIDGLIRTLKGSEASLSGGEYGNLRVSDGASVTLSGGWLNGVGLNGLLWNEDASITVVGGEFWLNDQPVATGGPGSTIDLELHNTDIISGKFADGRPFATSNYGVGEVVELSEGGATIRIFPLESSTISLRVADERTPPQKVFIFPGDEGVTQIGAGQTAKFADNDLLATTFTAFPGSRVELGRLAKVDRIDAYAAEIDMAGGSLWGARLLRNSEMEITGGTLYGSVFVQGGSRLTVLGGGRSGLWVADSESQQRWDLPDNPSEIHLVGTEFSTRIFTPEVTEAIQQLSEPGDSYIIPRRDPLDDGAGGTIPFVVDATLLNGRTVDWELSATRLVPDGPFQFKDEIVVNDQAIARITIGFPAGYCDVNGSESCDLGDIDALRTMFGSGDRHFDLTYDGLVDEDDEQQLLRNGFGGDANLDGAVDAKDLNTVALNWQFDVLGWSDGDFDGDGRVGTSDLNIIGLNWRSGVTEAPIPEPSAHALTVLLTGVLLLLRRRVRTCEKSVAQCV